MFKAGLHIVHLWFGLLLFPVVYVFVSGIKVENHYLAALAFYAPLAVLFALYVRHKCQPSKELVDLVYYSTGIVSVVLFTWINSKQVGELHLPRGDLKQAIAENFTELEAAKRFNHLFFSEPKVLVHAANEYLKKLGSSPVQSACIHEYGLHDGHTGISYKDRFGVIIRGSMSLDLDAPIKVSKECEKAFGGAPITSSLLNFWKNGQLANFHSEDIPFSEIVHVSEIESNLHFFFPLQVTSKSLTVSNFVEYLIGSDGSILSPTEIEMLSDVERDYHSLPVDLSWFDHFLTSSFSKLGGILEYAIWPVIGIFLLSLKITTISKK